MEEKLSDGTPPHPPNQRSRAGLTFMSLGHRGQRLRPPVCLSVCLCLTHTHTLLLIFMTRRPDQRSCWTFHVDRRLSTLPRTPSVLWWGRGGCQ